MSKLGITPHRTIQGTIKQMEALQKHLLNNGFRTINVRQGDLRKVHAPHGFETADLATFLSAEGPAEAALALVVLTQAIVIEVRLAEISRRDIIVLHKDALPELEETEAAKVFEEEASRNIGHENTWTDPTNEITGAVGIEDNSISLAVLKHLDGLEI